MKLRYVIFGVALLVVIAIMLFPSVGTRGRGRPPVSRCMSALHQIGLACQMYAEDHSGEFPSNFWAMAPDYGGNPKAYICPASGNTPGDISRVDQWTDFVFIPHLCSSHPSNTVLASCPPNNHDGAGGNILFVDGSVCWYNAQEFTNVLKRGPDRALTKE